ncbi:MAG: S-methyl-5-thioribose-1-phosphate isomerase [Planctomycetota bacterium]
MIQTIRWNGDREGAVVLIDQTALPDTFLEIEIRTPDEMAQAIRRLAVRGAPAIGVAAAYGVCLATRGLTDSADIMRAARNSVELLSATRPTAVNLPHMLARMRAALERGAHLAGHALRDSLLTEARNIHTEDVALCAAIGRAGAHLIRPGMTILTHCNAGALATGGTGTALAVLYEATRRGISFQVIADETRPLLQGARLTAWELSRAGIPVTVICDSAAAQCFAQQQIDLVITGADRITARGDSANKIGTYGVACLAHAHDVPFYVAAPSTTFDFNIADGAQIPIEERDAAEVWRIAAQGPKDDRIQVRNPAFDVTPSRLIRGWITECGVLSPPFDALRK